MRFDLTALYQLQGELDIHIQGNHGLTYEGTRDRRILALLVELGELANETRAFKFWSLKGPSPLEKIMDEYADGMHFFLSLGIYFGTKKMVYEVTTPPCDMVHHIMAVYHHIDEMAGQLTPAAFEAAFASYLNMLPLLGVDDKMAEAAYRAKLAINYERQKNKY